MIQQILTDTFSPQHLLVKDQSHLHAGHAGAQGGGGHFDVTIKAAAFSGCSRIEAHKLIYTALQDLMSTEVHALSIKASAPE